MIFLNQIKIKLKRNIKFKSNNSLGKKCRDIVKALKMS